MFTTSVEKIIGKLLKMLDKLHAHEEALRDKSKDLADLMVKVSAEKDRATRIRTKLQELLN